MNGGMEMAKREEVNLRARTTKEISGVCIGIIPIGTEFTITWMEKGFVPSSIFDVRYCCCKGLKISEIATNEFEFL